MHWNSGRQLHRASQCDIDAVRELKPPQLAVEAGWNPMSKALDEILNSILEDFKAGRQAKEELETKALFRLLN